VRLGLEEAVPGAPDTEWSVILQYDSNVRQEAANIFSQIDEVVASDISDDSEVTLRVDLKRSITWGGRKMLMNKWSMKMRMKL